MLYIKLQVAYLGIVGGKSEEDTIDRVLAATVGNNLARMFNWNGLKDKKAFKKLELCNVIYGIKAIFFVSLTTACHFGLIYHNVLRSTVDDHGYCSFYTLTGKECRTCPASFPV